MPHKETYSSGLKFVVSIPGLLKISALILFIASSVIFLITPICDETSSWMGNAYAICGASSGIIIFLMYVISVSGCVKRSYGTWTLIDLIFNIIDFTVMLIVSIITLSNCSDSRSSLQMVPAPMGIIGAVLLATSSAVWYAQSRESSDVSLTREMDPRQPPIYTKSVMI